MLNHHKSHRRVVSFSLGVGIFFLPIIFSWFTLRKGYGLFARIISIGWMAIFIFSALQSSNDLSSSSSTHSTDQSSQSKPKITEKPKKRSCWSMGQYIDDFGDDSGDRFISTKLIGTFSNSATTNSLLKVDVVVESSTKISIILYEYGSSRVKEHTSTSYILKIRTKQGDSTLTGENWADRIVLTSQSANILHRHLINNREIKFYVRKDSEFDSLTKYSFQIPNNCLYKKVFLQL